MSTSHTDSNSTSSPNLPQDSRTRVPSDDMSGSRTDSSVERIIRIDADLKDVWKALTEADELQRWFPVEADVDPGEGGRIRHKWSENTWFEESIEIWEPEKHLRTVGIDGGWSGITTDYELTTEKGSTVLRVVSSGFGPDDDWQEMLDAFGGGWDFELRGLRHYLERHPDEDRGIVRAQVAYDTAPEECWRRLAGPGGWLDLHTAAEDAVDLETGEAGAGDDGMPAPFAAHTRTDEIFTGMLYDWNPPKQIVAAVNEFGDALLRIQVLPESIGSMATLWLSTYGVDKSDRDNIRRRWQAYLDEHIAD